MRQRKIRSKKDRPQKNKLSLVKRSNIGTNKRLKQRRSTIRDEIKTRTGSSYPKRHSAPANKLKIQAKFRKDAQDAGLMPKSRKELEEEEENEGDDPFFESAVEQETVTEDDLHYIRTMAKPFLSGVDGSEGGKAPSVSKKRRKRNDDEEEDGLASYERQPRSLQEEVPEERKKMKQMLPIKGARGLMKQWMERGDLENLDDSGDSSAEEESAKQKKQKKALPPVSTVQLFVERKEKIATSKQEIATLASAVIANPEQNILKLNSLRGILSVDQPGVVLTVRKLAMVSLTEVFKDIIPGYKVRDWAHEDKKVLLSRQVRRKREHEESLVINYQKFLEFLDKTVKEMLTGRRGKGNKRVKWSKSSFQMTQQAKVSLAVVACQCLCDLLMHCAHFNFNINIIAVIVSMMFYRNPMISGHSIECMKTLFSEQQVGNGLVDAVSCISKKIKGRNFKVDPKVLDTFLSLRIKETNLRKEDEETFEEKKDKLTKRKEKISKMTRPQKRHQKQIEHLEKEHNSAQLAVGEERILKLNTEIIQAVFATYFRVLKTATDSTLLPSVLEGLAKFAHLINIDFFDDLVKVLSELISSGTLKYRESLHCVLTAFNVLSGQGDVLNIDPTRFYTHLYTNLLTVDAGCSSPDATIIIRCLDAMIFKRHRQITIQRVMAYLKRLGTLSLQTLPNATLAFLSAMRNIMLLYPKTDILLDRESFGSGLFIPELQEPEHCHAQNTALWELHLLKNHFHPIVKPYARNILKRVPIKGSDALDITMSRKKPMELFKEYDSSEMNFNPPVLTKPGQSAPKTSRKRKFNVGQGKFIQPEIISGVNSCLESADESGANLDFFAHLTRKRTKVDEAGTDEKVVENGDGKDMIEEDVGTDRKRTVTDTAKPSKAGQFGKTANVRRSRNLKATAKHFGSIAHRTRATTTEL